MSQITPQQFQDKVLSWYDCHGRKALPWQQPRTPYTVWLSEIMLQQTQVATVIPYFERFIERFATVEALAAAELDEVLQLWSGLGYYSRARNLHRAAKQIIALEQFPDTLEQLLTLPGVGRSTAGAIISQAFKRRAAILDGNVKRLLVRFYAVDGWPGERSVEKRLWQLTEALAPEQRAADYTQAVMDLGALICSRSQPNCSQCPLQQTCLSYHSGRQNELPHKKPRKQLPLRSTIMVIIRNGNKQTCLCS
ncbi:MAG: A/G-specific adenine glycosylase [Gammaproteobacteria bacterium]|nr:A/G-specific adenine glycosylase [Gammaproteobacteria bacterium]